MDLSKLLNSVKNVNDYITITQDLTNKYKSQNIEFNMSVVLSLKNVRSLEIEYFNKCDDSGAAFKIFERLLRLSPSKSWNLLGKELISLLQYWLDAVRKHLISHHIHWWTFLKHILFFIKEIRLKDRLLTNIIVEKISEGLLDLASSSKPNTEQIHEILHTFNLCCADSSREIRLALRIQFEHFFIKLATVMATCGHLPTQYSILETLLRWLQPRQDPAIRREAAAKWFPAHLYQRNAVEVFLERQWLNFFQDARDFLNAHNETSRLVTSVVCRKLYVGNTTLISGSERKQSWLDINTGNLSMTVLLAPLDAGSQNCCETLTVASDNVAEVKLHRESVEVTLSVCTFEAPRLFPSSGSFADARDVTLVVSSRSDMARLDATLRSVFHEKYQVLLDIENMTCMSPPQDDNAGKKSGCITEETRFSHPAKEKRRKHSGYIVRPGRPVSWRSPSSVSTSSLAQLHDKLAALPRYTFDKEPVSVCAQPELSVVTEISEVDEIRSSLETNSTLKLRPAVFHKSFRHYIEEKKSQSDGETLRLKRGGELSDTNQSLDTTTSTLKLRSAVSYKNFKGSQSDGDNVKTSNVADREVATSSLFAATIGSADESIINATLERLPRNKELNTDHLIELLVQEALQSKNDRGDSGIHTGEGKKCEEGQESSEAIENNSYLEQKKAAFENTKAQKEYCTVISKSTTSTDESNTEAINDTPACYVNVRKKNLRKDREHQGDKTPDSSTHDVQAVEDFFSQHFAENQAGELIISPTLAKKINDTSSETSEDFDDCLIANNFMNVEQFEMHDMEIIECISSMVDKVCSDLDKCTAYLYREVQTEKLGVEKNESNKETVSTETFDKRGKSKTTESKAQSNKLTYKTGKKQKVPKAKKPQKNKLIFEPVQKMSTIIEDYNEVNDTIENKNSSPASKDLDTPLIRKKRKLYSPKDDEKNIRNDEKYDKSDDKDIPLANTAHMKAIKSNTSATCYKELEIERQNFRRTRARKSRSKVESISPKSKKLNEVFDKLKDKIESNENILLADVKSCDKENIYNFTSDSEDEDFKKKKIETQKKASTTTLDSVHSMMSTRRGRTVNKVKYTEKDSGNSSNETNKKPRPKRSKRPNSKISRQVRTEDRCLEDERMRKNVPEDLNTSFLKEKTSVLLENEEIDPKILVPEVEMVVEDDEHGDTIKMAKQDVEITKAEKKKPKKRTDRVASVKKERGRKVMAIDLPEKKEDERTVSPLPGLVVETVHNDQRDADDSLTTNMVQKFNRIYKDGPEACNDTNTTQNLLSDNERVDNSPQMNITEEFNKYEDDNKVEKADVRELANRKRPHKTIVDEQAIIAFEDYINDSTGRESNVESTKKKLKRNLRLKSKGSESETDISKVTNKKSNGNINKTLKLKSEKVDRNRQSKSPSDSKEIIVIKAEVHNYGKKCEPKISKRIETLDASELNENKSEKSIATVGITAHGDISEQPPSAEALVEKLLPRELEDMDPSLKEYYVSLGKAINRDSTEQTVKPSKVIKSPVVNLSRLSSDELSVWHGNDISKWLPSRRESESEDTESDVYANYVSVRQKSRKASRATSKVSDQSQSLNKSPVSTTKYDKTNQKQKDHIFDVNLRKSLISPVKLFEERLPTNKKDTCEEEIKKSSQNTKKTSAKSPQWRKYDLRDSTKGTNRYFLRSSSVQSSPKSRISTSTPIASPRIKASVKRVLASCEKKERKKRRVNEIKVENVTVSSGPSVTSVDDWLEKNMAAGSKGINLDVSVRDTIQNVIEKLDTTLAEINRNSSRNFIHLFVEAQRRLNEMRQQRLDMYRENATGILTRVAQVLEEEFMQLDNRSREAETQFMGWMKQRAVDFIREDCSRKQAMVLLLREDTQAVLDHLESQRP